MASKLNEKELDKTNGGAGNDSYTISLFPKNKYTGGSGNPDGVDGSFATKELAKEAGKVRAKQIFDANKGAYTHINYTICKNTVYVAETGKFYSYDV